MEFRCANCRTPYRIKDSLVRGRVLTIRCVKCSRLFSLTADGHTKVSTDETPWATAEADGAFEHDVDVALDRISSVEDQSEVAPWNDEPRAAGDLWNVVYLPGVRPPPLPRVEPDFAIEIDESAIESIALHPEDEAPRRAAPGLRVVIAAAMVAGFLAVGWPLVEDIATGQAGFNRASPNVAAYSATDPITAHIPREIFVIDLNRKASDGVVRANDKEAVVRDSVAAYSASHAKESKARVRRRDRDVDPPRLAPAVLRVNPANPADLTEPELTLKPIVMTAGLLGDPSAATPSASPVGPTPDTVDNPVRDLDSERALSVFRSRYLEAVNRCYESARRVEPDVAGRVNVTMQIDSSGRIQSLALSQLQDTGFARCLNEKATTWRFPEMTGGAVIAYSLNLVPL